MRAFVHDLRYGLRTLARRPGFTAVATLVLALGIGSTTAIFSVVDAVVLRPLPYPDPARLVVLWEANERRRIPLMNLAPPNLADWRARSRSFEAIGAWRNRSFTVVRDGLAEQLAGGSLTHDMFDVLRVPPALGRTFTAEEHAGAGAPVALISHAYWRRAFAGDRTVVGQLLQVDGEPREIVGVMPEGFDFAPPVELEGVPTGRRNDLWLPLAAGGLSNQRGAHYLLALGRLRPSVDAAAAERELRAIADQLAQAYPDTNAGWSARVVPFDRQVTGDQRPALSALGLAVGMVLLLACANVAALLLARGVGRRRELAIRGALGATRGRLSRQLLTESLVLALAGGVAGSVLASWMVRAVRLMAGPLMPRLDEVAIDARALAFAVVACVIASLLFGALPALQAARADARTWLASRGGSGRTARLQPALVVVELALSIVLLSAAALVGSSFVRLVRTDPGFEPQGVVTGHVRLPQARYPDRGRRAAFLDGVMERMRAAPGVASAGAIDAAPIADDRQGTSVEIVGRPPLPGESSPTVNFAFVTPGYFQALGVRVIRGRDFTAQDGPGTLPVLIVNEAFARLFFGDEDPVGRQVRAGFNTQTPREIIAVVGNERHVGLGVEPAPGMYATFGQMGGTTQLSLALRATTGEASAAAAMRAAVRAVDPEVPLYDVRSMTQVVGDSVSRPRFAVAVTGAFAVVALLLSAVGVYGVMSQAVAQRTSEFGVRLALGAAPADLRRLVLGFGGRLLGAGLLLGIPAAILFGRVLASLLAGVDATALTGYAVVSLVLALSVMLSALLPAIRASRVDPIVALRTD